jgi:hypothetical protein
LKDVKKRLGERSIRCLQKNGNPLVVIVDELDRCRPLFAIGLLEKIKHLFEIPGIIFVLGVDRTQLGHSIKSVYGQEMDVDGYLRRFIDLEFLLPTNNSKCKFLSSYFNKLGIESVINDNVKKQRIINYSSCIAKVFLFSLRDMEYLCRTLMLCAVTGQELFGNSIVPFLVAMKLKNEDFYKDVISGKLNAVEMIEHLVEKYNFFHLFENERFVGSNLIDDLVYSFYSISPQEWLRDIQHLVSHDSDSRSASVRHDGYPSEYFHSGVKTHFGLETTVSNQTDNSRESIFLGKLRNIALGREYPRLSDISQWIEFSQNSEHRNYYS